MWQDDPLALNNDKIAVRKEHYPVHPEKKLHTPKEWLHLETIYPIFFHEISDLYEWTLAPEIFLERFVRVDESIAFHPPQPLMQRVSFDKC